MQEPDSGPEPGSAVVRWASTRETYLDNLKVVLIAAIIAIHGVVGYVSLEVWSYTEVRETTLLPLTETLLLVLVAPFGLFVIALLFLVSGLLTPPALQRRGTGSFVRARLMRLGVPFGVYVLVVQPSLMYALGHPLGVAPGSFWDEYLGDEGKLDTGPLWFVGVLLVFSLAYALVHAGWMRLGWPMRPLPGRPGEVTARNLLVVAAGVVPLSFLVRLVYPYGSESGFTDLNLWEWPACAALFGLGVAASRLGWLASVPDDLCRRCRTATVLAGGGFVALVVVATVLDLDSDRLGGGWGWPALWFAAVEGSLTVFGPVWLLGVTQRRLRQTLPHGAALARSAYGAFLVQAPVLIGLAVALRPVPVPAEVKALVVAAGGVAGSFWLASVAVTRVRGLRRVL